MIFFFFTHTQGPLQGEETNCWGTRDPALAPAPLSQINHINILKFHLFKKSISSPPPTKPELCLNHLPCNVLSSPVYVYPHLLHSSVPINTFPWTIKKFDIHGKQTGWETTSRLHFAVSMIHNAETYPSTGPQSSLQDFSDWDVRWQQSPKTAASFIKKKKKNPRSLTLQTEVIKSSKMIMCLQAKWSEDSSKNPHNWLFFSPFKDN